MCTKDVYCEGQLEFIRLDAILVPAALCHHSFESFSVVLFSLAAVTFSLSCVI